MFSSLSNDVTGSTSLETPPQLLPNTVSIEDVRVLVSYLARRAGFAPVGEARMALKRWILDPRRIDGYEAWGLLHRADDGLALSPRGWELARNLERESRLFRATLDGVRPYRSTLAWLHRRNTDIALSTTVAAYWRNAHPSALGAADDKTVKEGVASFFRLCQAAALGTLISSAKGVPVRFIIDRVELRQYLAGD